MEDMFFAAFLYLLDFCFVCWLLAPNTPEHPATTRNSPELSLSSLQAAFAVEPEPDTEADPDKEPEPDTKAESDTEAEAQSDTDDSLTALLAGIEIEKLKLRVARKIASRLGIRQKVNGKDQPLAWLRSQIKKRLEEEPQSVSPVIYEVLSVA